MIERKRSDLELIAVQILVLVFSVVVHEVAHGWTAWQLGDPTAHEAGRLTLNPLPHIDPVGSIVVPLILSLTGGIMFGWAKPVPVHPGRLNNPMDDHPKVAAAGPGQQSVAGLGLCRAAGFDRRDRRLSRAAGHGGQASRPC